MSKLINQTRLKQFATKLWDKIKNRYDNAFVNATITTKAETDKKIKFTKASGGTTVDIDLIDYARLSDKNDFAKDVSSNIGMVDGTLIINNDNDLLHDYYLNNDNKKNTITIGIDNNSDYKAININENDNNSEFDVVFKNQTIHILCPIPGRAYIYNSLCAIAVGSILSIDNNKIIDGIKNIHLTKNRLEFINLKNDIKIINGIYNASVDSMKASIEVLKNQTCNRKIAVLGDMLELGCYSKELHQGIGRFVYENNIDVLITVGRDSSYISSEAIKCGMNKNNVYTLSNNNDAISILSDIILPGDAILLKASNGLHFKEILNEIIKGS